MLHFEPDGEPYAENGEQEKKDGGMHDLPALPPDLRDAPFAASAQNFRFRHDGLHGKRRSRLPDAETGSGGMP